MIKQSWEGKLLHTDTCVTTENVLTTFQWISKRCNPEIESYECTSWKKPTLRNGKSEYKHEEIGKL